MFTSILTNFSSLFNYCFFELCRANTSSQSPAMRVKNPNQNTAHEPLPWLCHEPVAELTALWDPHLHFTTFKNSIIVQKQTLVKLFGRMPDILSGVK